MTVSINKVDLKNSISVQLLKAVFSVYLVLTLFITVIHMSAEFWEAKNQVRSDIEVISQNFIPVLAQALWEVNESQIQTSITGMVNFPSIIGVKLVDQQTEKQGSGIILNDEGTVVKLDSNGVQEELSEKIGIFQLEFPIVLTIREKKYDVGTAYIYSSTLIVLNQVKLGFLFIIVNSIIKVIAFWLIFLWISGFMLRKPLAVLTKATEHLSLDKLKDFQVRIQTKGENELKLLEQTFNSMVSKLRDAVTALQEKERQDIELQTAQTVQEMLIPSNFPELEEIELACFYQSASETGGDWYDFRYHQEHQTLEVLIGDVTGHGVPAAIVTGMVDSVYDVIHDIQCLSQNLSLAALPQISPSSFMEILNNVLHRTLHGRFTLSLFYSVIDLQKKQMIYSSAAHRHCYLFRPAGFSDEKGKVKHIQHLKMRSRTVGQQANTVYQIQTQNLQKDDTLLWYTDGLTENKNAEGEMLGHRAVKTLLQQSEGLSAEEIKEQIVVLAYQHFGEHPKDDDITFIVGKVM